MTAPVPTYDVVVIGAGVVGTAIARELTRYELSVAIVDGADDVGEGTTKANTAILHTGFDATPGTLEARLVPRGYQLLKTYAEVTGIALDIVGALLVAWDEEQLAALPGLEAKARANGYDACRLLSAEEVYAEEPRLGAGALGGLHVPDEAVICPWTTPLAFATEAVGAGADLLLGHRVASIESGGDGHLIRTSRGELRCGWLINAAGLYSDEIDAQLGHRDFVVTPRKGELIVFDKLARPLVRHIVLPVPTARGKGVLVAPTVFGNVLLGPTADDVSDKTDTSTTAAGLAGLLEKGHRILPDLVAEQVTALYAGLRAATEHGDYQIRYHAEQRYVCVGGIRSTGLTASMAIAEYVAAALDGSGLGLRPRSDLPEAPRMPPLGEGCVRPYQSATSIAADPAYGDIVCHCERVTRGEIRDALAAVVPAVSVSGVARRTRATNGRCQGFFCGSAVRALVERR